VSIGKAPPDLEICDHFAVIPCCATVTDLDAQADIAGLQRRFDSCRRSRIVCGANTGERARTLKKKLAAVGLRLMNNPSHIVPVFVADAVRCKVMSDRLLKQHGSYIQPINYRALGIERLRLTPTPQRPDADMDHLGTLLAEAGLTPNVDNAKIGYERQLTR